LGVSLSAHANGTVDHSTNIHFSAQEISMQLRVREAGKMNTRSMCFLLGSTGVPRRTLNSAISASSMKAEIKAEIVKLAETIEANSMRLAKLCDGNGSVILNSAMQPVYLSFVSKPKVSEVETLMNGIAQDAEKIVSLNIQALQERN